ncbi:MAG: PEGA domain-containing protein [Candidatus Cloacimonetes bacterium]|nr:PEGA domain-containing protein [Candidatus Cloacimonadota bacterium]
MEDKYSLLYSDEDKKKEILNSEFDLNHSDKEYSSLAVMFLEIITTKDNKEFYFLYHDEIVIPLLKKHEAKIIKERSNPIICTFENAVNAMEAAISMQKKIAEKNAGKEKTVISEIKIGIHFGKVMALEHDIFGGVVDICSSILFASDANQIFVSEDFLKRAFQFKMKSHYIANFHLKGAFLPVKLYSVFWTDNKTWMEYIFENHKKKLLITKSDKFRIINEVNKVEEFNSTSLISVAISSKPTGFEIWIDGKKIQKKTPATFNHKVGECLLHLTKQGYEDITERIDIKPDQPNEFSFNLEAIYGSINIVTESPGYSIVLNGKELSRKTPHKIVNAMPGSYKIELVGKTHYTNPITMILKEKEDHIFSPKLLPYGRLVVISKLKDLDFMLKDSKSYDKIKLDNGKLSFEPYRIYEEKKCKEITLKKGTYIIVPLDEKLPEVQIEINNDELNIFNYDEHLVKRKIIIDTGKYHARISFNHQRTGRKNDIHVKGKKVLEFIPGTVSLKIQSKLLTKEYNLKIEKHDVNLEFVKEMTKIAKKHSKKIINRFIIFAIFMSFLFVGLYYYSKYENKIWKKSTSENSILGYDKYIDTIYFFRYKKTALKFILDREEEYWLKTKIQNSDKSYQRYLEIFSEPKFKTEAREKLKEIIWDSALNSKNPRIMKRYIMEFPEAENLSEAIHLYKNNYWENIKQKNSMLWFTIYLRKFPESPHKNEATVLRNNIFFSINKGHFWVDKGYDIKNFFISSKNLQLKIIVLVVLLIIFVKIFISRGKKY